MVYIGNKDSGSGANAAAAIEYDYDDCDFCACGECAAGLGPRASDYDLGSSGECPDGESQPTHYRLWLKDIDLPTGYHSATTYTSSSTELPDQSFVYFSWYNFLVNHINEGLGGLPILLSGLGSWTATFYVGDFFVAGDNQRTWDVGGANDLGPSDIDNELMAFKIELIQKSAYETGATPPSTPSGVTVDYYHELTIKLLNGSVQIDPVPSTGGDGIEIFKASFATTCEQTFPSPGKLIGPIENEHQFSGDRVVTWDSGFYGRDMAVPTNGIAYLMACEGEKHLQDYYFDHFGNLHEADSATPYVEGTLQLDRNCCYKISDSDGIRYRKEESDSHAFAVNAGDSNSPQLYKIGDISPLGYLEINSFVEINPIFDSSDYWRYYRGIGASCGAISPATQGNLSSNGVEFYSFGARYQGQIVLSSGYNFDFSVKSASSYYVVGVVITDYFDRDSATFSGGIANA